MFQLQLTQRLLQLMRENTNVNGSKQASLELINILERWLLSQANQPDPQTSWSRIYRNLPLDHPVHLKLRKELQRKGLTTDEAAGAALVERAASLIELTLIEQPPQLEAKPQYLQRTLSFGTFSEPTNARLDKLRLSIGIELTIALCLRYQALLSDHQHWAIPQAHFDYLYYTYGVRNEGFASALNSRALMQPEGRFCSLFSDLESSCGSLGNFETVDMLSQRGAWFINPPFINTIMLEAAQRCLTALATGPITIFHILPAWDDDEANRALSSSAHLISKERLEPRTYAYENLAGRQVLAQFASYYYILSSQPDAVASPDEPAKQLRSLIQAK